MAGKNEIYYVLIPILDIVSPYPVSHVGGAVDEKLGSPPFIRSDVVTVKEN